MLKRILNRLQLRISSQVFGTSKEGQRIGREVSLEEIEEILKKFSKSNSPGPDG